ncbi:MAG: hypothetical protein LBT81_06045 [Helicobacteraceae bacterium]|nr:hypothetical protein [Helicobacteraceae bacterium]
MITGFILVDETEKSYLMLAFYDDSFTEGHKKLTDIAHAHNTNIILQLVYVGLNVMNDPTEVAVLAPSAIENLNTQVIPKEISLKEIKNAQSKFAEAALRAKDAGCETLKYMRHMAFLSQFMMPYYNRGNDLYGGSASNKARMILETYEKIRKSVGKDYPIWIKINVTYSITDGVSFSMSYIYVMDCQILHISTNSMPCKIQKFARFFGVFFCLLSVF